MPFFCRVWSSNVAPNVVKREFRQKPRKVLLTDITYLFFGDEKCYLSTVLDAFTHEILAWQLSQSLKVDFVLETIDQLVREYGSTLDNETIVHSDQGCHYTSYAFIQKLRDSEFIQSMSRRGNCWDNASQESFFGHMKDEICEKIRSCASFDDVKSQVDDYISYYNEDRYVWDLCKLSPDEYYSFVTAGKYPIKGAAAPLISREFKAPEDLGKLCSKVVPISETTGSEEVTERSG